MTDLNIHAQKSDNMELWFQMIYNELREVESCIDVKDGFLFFKKHTFSRDEILAFPQFKKINAISGQIDDVVMGWRNNNSISDERYRFYHENRLQVERRIGELRARIIERKPTFWEGVVSALSQLLKIIMDNLPLLAEQILARIGFSPSFQQRLLYDRREKMSRAIDADDDL